MKHEESAELLARVGAGDDAAAEVVFLRFAERLLALAATRLSEKLMRRVDAEDVVQSAYRSFFVGARDGRFVVMKSGDLWRLLVGITLHKVQRQVEHHTAGKRALAQEAAPASSECLGVQALAREPSPLEAAVLADECELLMRSLPPDKRPILELRLQGHGIDEIGEQLGCSERTVRRTLDQVKKTIEARNWPSGEEPSQRRISEAPKARSRS